MAFNEDLRKAPVFLSSLHKPLHSSIVHSFSAITLFEDSTKTFEGFGGDPTVCKETIHIFSVASGCLGVEMVGVVQMQMKIARPKISI